MCVKVSAASVLSANVSSLVTTTLAVLCDASMTGAPEELADARLLESLDLQHDGVSLGWQARYILPDRAEIRVARIAVQDVLRRIDIEYGEVLERRLLPMLMVQADGECVVRRSHRITYTAHGLALSIQRLSTDFERVEVSEKLNPPIPEGEAHPGVLVALVDSGVNYELPELVSSLARDSAGNLIGYDFWDMDARPFDAGPVRSAFEVQRHGTQVASLLLAEGPPIQLVVYRHPHSDLSRMQALVEDAASHGVRIVNILPGTDRREDWQQFAQAVVDQPRMLFVVSAGDDGRDLDQQPIFPAALALENLISVTSTDDFGRPSDAANWGRNSVAIGVPAENVLVTDFYGRPRLVSGSGYAAARISALAACLLSATPALDGGDLRAAIMAFVEEEPGANEWFSVGVIFDPDEFDRGDCPAARTAPEIISTFDLAQWGELSDVTDVYLVPQIVLLQETGWSEEELGSMLAHTASVLSQCGIQMPRAKVTVAAVPELLKFYSDYAAHQLVRLIPSMRPAVILMKDTLKDIAFEAEAIGNSNSRGRRELLNTVWMTRAISHPAVGLAHELVHVIMDSGEHHSQSGNLMQARSFEHGNALDGEQCRRIIETGFASGLLSRKNPDE